jgi:hypothetical protein
VSANERQVGGGHYKNEGHEEHWDRVARLGLDYFQAQITKYVERCWLKNGVEDLEKARHFIDKYIELSRAARRVGVSEARRKDSEEEYTQIVDSLEQERAEWEQRINNVRAQFSKVLMANGSNDFLFEGGMGTGHTLWQCKKCLRRFQTEANALPYDVHSCVTVEPLVIKDFDDEGDAAYPGPHYVNQG